MSTADVVAADLRRIEELLRPDPEVSRIEAALVTHEGVVVRLLGELDNVDPLRVTARRLEDKRLSWLGLRAQLQRWAPIINARFSSLQAERERLRDERIQWEETQATADAEELSPELLRRIESTLERLRDVEQRVRERRNDVGAIADQIASGNEEIADAIQRIDDLDDGTRRRLFERDAAPLWQSLGAVDATALAAEAGEVGRDWVGALGTYVGLYRTRFVFLFLLYGILLMAVRAVRFRSARWSADDDSLRFARRLLSRPYSVALALALATTAAILPFPVGAVSDVLLVLVLVPMMRIGSVVFEAEARRTLYGTAALTVLMHLGSLGPESSTISRVVFLLVSTLAAAGATWSAWKGYRCRDGSDRWRRLLNAVTGLAGLLFASAAVAGVMGWLGLSHLLTRAVLGAAFTAFAWWIVAAVVVALLPAFFLGGPEQPFPSLRRNQHAIARVLIRATILLAFVGWVRGLLDRLGVWDPFRGWLAEVAAAGVTAGDLTISIGGVFGAIAILVVTSIVARLVGFILREEVMPRLDMRRAAAQSVITLLNYVMYGLGIVLAASLLGLRGTQLTVVIGALSVGIGFGLQTIVNNFVSGLILIFERPIKVGDVVQTVDYWGRIERIGIRASIIRSFDGAEIVVPNGDLIAKEVINWTRSDEIRRIEVLVGVAYGSDPKTVLELLFRVASEHPLTLEEPEPRAQMIDFGNSSLDFRVRCWTTMENWVQVASDLRVVIYDELAEAGINIPFPQRDLHLKSSLLNSEEEKTKLGEAIE